MKQLIPFSEFLNDRFSPCIFCIASTNVMGTNPNIAKEILSTWEKITKNYRLVVRMIFPMSICGFSSAVSELLNMRNLYPGTQPFFFVENDISNQIHGEISSIQLLRQKVFESDLFPPYCFSDIPISILLIKSSDKKEESLELPDNFLKKWIKEETDKIKKYIIEMPCDLEKELIKFFEEKYLIDLSLRQNNLFDKYNKSYNTKISKFFRKRNEPTESEICLKYYADYQFQVKCYDEAKEIYEDLYNSPLSQQCYLMSAFCDIASQFFTPNTIELLEKALIDCTNDLERFGIYLCQFYVENTYEKFQKIIENSKKYLILRPFLMEQVASFLNRKKSAFRLFISSIDYDTFKCYEHSLKCKIMALGMIKEKGFEKIKISLIHEMMNIYLKGNYSKFIASILTERFLSNPLLLQEMLRKTQINELLECGFVDIQVKSFLSEGFARTIPDGFNKFWPKTGQQLFGAFRSNDFLNYNIFNVLECSTKKPLMFSIFFKSLYPIFKFTNIKLKIKADFEIEQNLEEYNGNNRIMNFSILPKGGGPIVFDGLLFDWESIHFQKHFKFNPINFISYSNAPLINVEIISSKYELYVGEIIQVKIIIQNLGINLKHLGMALYGNVKYEILNSHSDEISGQQFLTPLKENEKTEILLSILGENIGKYDLLIIFPYWAENPPVQYISKHLNFTVKQIPENSIKVKNSELTFISPDGFQAIGFTSSHFDPDPHVIELKNETGIFNFISTNKRHTKLVLPNYCVPFIDESPQLCFWCKSNDSYLSIPFIKNQNCVVCNISFEEQYICSIMLKNISNLPIYDFKISIFETDERITFLHSGTQIKSIENFKNEQTFKFKIRIIPLDKQIKPTFIISGETFSFSREISIDFDKIFNYKLNR